MKSGLLDGCDILFGHEVNCAVPLTEIDLLWKKISLSSFPSAAQTGARLHFPDGRGIQCAEQGSTYPGTEVC